MNHSIRLTLLTLCLLATTGCFSRVSAQESSRPRICDSGTDIDLTTSIQLLEMAQDEANQNNIETSLDLVEQAHRELQVIGLNCFVGTFLDSFQVPPPESSHDMAGTFIFTRPGGWYSTYNPSAFNAPTTSYLPQLVFSNTRQGRTRNWITDTFVQGEAVLSFRYGTYSDFGIAEGYTVFQWLREETNPYSRTGEYTSSTWSEAQSLRPYDQNAQRGYTDSAARLEWTGNNSDGVLIVGELAPNVLVEIMFVTAPSEIDKWRPMTNNLLGTWVSYIPNS